MVRLKEDISQQEGKREAFQFLNGSIKSHRGNNL